MSVVVEHSQHQATALVLGGKRATRRTIQTGESQPNKHDAWWF